MSYKYSTPLTDNCAKAVGISLPISRKQSSMICLKIKGMRVPDAKELLADVIELNTPIPYPRHHKTLPHRKGNMAAGRWPEKASFHILNLLKSAEANAQFKGLSTGNLVIKHANAQKGPTTVRYGRKQTLAKRTHIELVLEEIKETKK